MCVFSVFIHTLLYSLFPAHTIHPHTHHTRTKTHTHRERLSHFFPCPCLSVCLFVCQSVCVCVCVCVCAACIQLASLRVSFALGVSSTSLLLGEPVKINYCVCVCVLCWHSACVSLLSFALTTSFTSLIRDECEGSEWFLFSSGLFAGLCFESKDFDPCSTPSSLCCHIRWGH